MAKAFSIASWNVEHFKGDPSRVNRVVDFLKDSKGGNKPDVFALYEVEGKQVYSALVGKLPGYSFHITEGPQVQEILVGVKSNITAFFTQRLEFKSGNTFLRPGALLSIHVGGRDYAILFLHTKSADEPIGFGIRDNMLSKATKFRSKLEKAQGLSKWSSRYLFLGDLNVMGMEYPYDRDIRPDTELKRLDGRAKRAKMRRLSKNAPHTFWNGTGSSLPPSDLDHIVASSNVSFKLFNGHSVSVRGWTDGPTAGKKDSWIAKYSDHCLLYTEVQQ